MNGELAHVQSEGLELKSSTFRSYNTCLKLKILAAVGLLSIQEMIGTD